MTDRQPTEATLDSRRAARRILRRNFFIYVAFAGLCAAALAASYLLPVKPLESDDKAKALSMALLMIFFFAATIISLGIQWAAKIIAARRYRRHAPHSAALAVAVSQWIIFAVYGAVVGLVAYYRLVTGGSALAGIPAVTAVLAAFYFLKVPGFLINGAYAASDEKESRC